MASQVPSSALTLFEMAKCVCRSGSPARESRWVNAVPIRPSTSTWRTPLVPRRVNSALDSMKPIASLIAAWWARSITAAVFGSAIAQSTETLLTGENVRS